MSKLPSLPAKLWKQNQYFLKVETIYFYMKRTSYKKKKKKKVYVICFTFTISWLL